jgi:hypothetical protein
MKSISNHDVLLGVWGLNLTSYLVSSIPYLQFASLVLAIVVSIVTLRKLMKQSEDNE